MGFWWVTIQSQWTLGQVRLDPPPHGCIYEFCWYQFCLFPTPPRNRHLHPIFLSFDLPFGLHEQRRNASPAGEAFSFFGNSQRKQFANCLKTGMCFPNLSSCLPCFHAFLLVNLGFCLRLTWLTHCFVVAIARKHPFAKFKTAVLECLFSGTFLLAKPLVNPSKRCPYLGRWCWWASTSLVWFQ